MLINLDYWRSENITSRMMEYISTHPERILYCDQDVFNVVMKGKIKPIHFKYNLQNGFLYNPKDMLCDYYGYKEEIDEAINDPVIVHYTASTQKPWLKGCKHPLKDEFLYYRKKTVFSDMALMKKKSISFKQILSALLGGLCSLKSPNYKSAVK